MSAGDPATWGGNQQRGKAAPGRGSRHGPGVQGAATTGLSSHAVQVEHSRPPGPFPLETCGRMEGSEQDRQGCQAESSLPASYPAPLCTLHPKC